MFGESRNTLLQKRVHKMPYDRRNQKGVSDISHGDLIAQQLKILPEGK